MEIIDYLLARKKAGGGSDVTVEQLSVTENGTYSEQGIAYSPVVVNVPAPENSYQLKDVPSGTVSTIDDGTALPMPSLKVGIEPVQSGSGDPSPDNIRPISGWNAANVTRCGKNLTDNATNGHYIDTDGTEKDLTSYRCTDYVNVNGITSLKTTVSTTYPNFWVWRIASYDINKNFIELSLNRTIANGDFEEEVTLPSNVKYIRACAIINSTNWNIYDKSTYNTYTIEFRDGDNPLTVYGGTLDVTSGELVVNRYLYSFTGNESFVSNPSAWGNYAFLYNTGINLKSSFSTLSYCKSSHLNIVNAGGWDSLTPNTFMIAGTIYMGIGFDGTVEELKAWLASQNTADTPVQIMGVLETPITYHLTPTQIRTLVGNNNIWADTGNIIEGKYFKSLS